MRIAFLSHQWPGARMGGIGSYVRSAAAALAEAGVDVHVFTLNLPAGVCADVPQGVHLHETPDLAARIDSGQLPAALPAALHAGGEGVYRLAIGQLLTNAFLEEHVRKPFDLVEAPEVEALGLPLLLHPTARVPVVTHLHCASALAFEGNGQAVGPREELIAALEWAAIGIADICCAPTRRVLELTRRHMGQTIEAQIIPHSLNAPTRSSSPPPTDGPVLFVGRLEKLKGCEILAQALVRFLADHPTAAVRFAAPDTNTAPGGGSMAAFIQETLGPALSSRVAFLGQIDRDQIEQELAAASFCVMPSLVENFSMALCEAMAAGRATIVADGTGSVEIVNEPGLIAEPGSADDLCARMTYLWRNRDELARLSRVCQARVQSLCDAKAVSAMRIDFYRRTIQQFQNTGLRERMDRLAALPPACIKAILPAMAAMTGALCGLVDDSDQTPGRRMARIMDAISHRTGKPAQVLLYAAGKHTARLLSERHVWERAGHSVVGIIDDHPRFQNEAQYLGLPVRSLRTTAEAARSGDAIPPVILSTDTYQEQFWQQTAPLREMGTPVHRLYPQDRSAAL
jgi:glycosyltransferase involved in cell wall biosynthesis